ncbi:MAG: site-specific DNA-methyltransferase [Phycisphaerales bacterium]|nr:site-specific DNA-methyltransferase [Phycisphaerales bacterium]
MQSRAFWEKRLCALSKEGRLLVELLKLLLLQSDRDSRAIGNSRIVQRDCFDWLQDVPENSIHSVVTDPPYGVKEYEPDQLAKREAGSGGVWRIPPAFDGHVRSPLPRFTALDAAERARLVDYFRRWARLITRVLRPGGHVFIATNSFVAQMVYGAVAEGGLEFRGQVIRLVRTLRGGDRPKNAEVEFEQVSSLPRGCFEPWGLFRKPMLPKMRVSDCLREFETGGLRRCPNGLPFCDVIVSERTPRQERQVASHPSLKPQSLLRQLVFASLPLGTGTVLDPFMGSGSTIAAAEAVGVKGFGVERSAEFFAMAVKAIPKLARLNVPHLPLPAGSNASHHSLFVPEKCAG